MNFEKRISTLYSFYSRNLGKFFLNLKWWLVVKSKWLTRIMTHVSSRRKRKKNLPPELSGGTVIKSVVVIKTWNRLYLMSSKSLKTWPLITIYRNTNHALKRDKSSIFVLYYIGDLCNFMHVNFIFIFRTSYYWFNQSVLLWKTEVLILFYIKKIYN